MKAEEITTSHQTYDGETLPVGDKITKMLVEMLVETVAGCG